MNDISRFLDEDGKLKQFPAKHAAKQDVCAYLARQFVQGREYTEPEINEIINGWHTFGDYFLLRRELVESGWLERLPDGSKYWKADIAGAEQE